MGMNIINISTCLALRMVKTKDPSTGVNIVLVLHLKPLVREIGQVKCSYPN